METNTSTEIAVFDFNPLSIVSMQKQVKAINELMKTVMQDGIHYGVIPGCGDKPTLLKPGAEKICLMFRLSPTFEILEKELLQDHREYRFICTLKDLSGNVIGQGVGSASTMESKHRYRAAERKCPNCGKATIIKGREEYGGGWLCFAKKGGCGEKFLTGDKSIEGQQIGRAENPDIADVFNTVLKMAKKRAHVDAVLTCTAASDCFTQDVEDFPQYDYTATVVPEKPKEPEAEKPKPEAKKPKTETKKAEPKKETPPPAQEVPSPEGFNGNPFSQVFEVNNPESKSSMKGKLIAEIYFEDRSKLDLVWNAHRSALTPTTTAALKAARDLIKLGKEKEFAKQAFVDEHGYEPEQREAA
jgi:hypothetical protein